MPSVSLVWPPKRSAAMPVRMPLRAAYTAAAAPAGPPPTMSTSYGALALSLAASLASELVSSLATISSTVMRPEANTWPLRKTMGTAMISRRSTSSWKAPPSMTVVLTFGFRMAMSDSACTTSGQLWQLRDMKTSKWKSPSRPRMLSSVSAVSLGGWPPVQSKASTSEVNSWPSGRPAKRSEVSAPVRCSENEGLRASWPSVFRVILSARRPWMVCSNSSISREFSESLRDATISKGCCTRSR